MNGKAMNEVCFHGVIVDYPSNTTVCPKVL